MYTYVCIYIYIYTHTHILYRYRQTHMPNHPSHEILESRDKVCSLLAHSTWLSLTPHLGPVLLLEAIVVAGPLRRTPLILTGIQVPFYFG